MKCCILGEKLAYMYKISYRHQYILDKIRDQGDVSVSRLSEKLKVSEVTIRKDLSFLEEKGLLFRTHGGAIQKNPYINERPVSEKQYINAKEKELIGKAGARLIGEDDTIIIASGTTVLAMAKEIRPIAELTVISASLNVSLELSKYKEIEILQLAGVLRKSSFSVVGSYSEGILSSFSCNKLFLGIDGLDPEFGLTTTSLQEAQLNQKMIEAAEQLIVLTDSNKFGRRGFGKICDLDKVDIIITDNKMPKAYLRIFKELGIEVIVAK